MRFFHLSALAFALASSSAWAQAPAPRNKPPEKASAPAPAKDATKAGVVEALQGSSPMTPERVGSMGKDADLVLIDLVRDDKVEREVRGRAIDALAASGTVVARDQLVRMATSTGDELEVTLLRRALLGLGWMRDGRATDIISPWLTHPEAQVRTDAAVALALTKTKGALETLERHKRGEKDAGVRSKVERLIRQLRHELPPEPKRRQEQPRVQPPPPVEGRNSTRF